MGNTSGKPKTKNGSSDPQSNSFHDLNTGQDHLSEREASSAWYRYGVSVTDVYDVVEILGQGHMGEVFTVRRKTTGHHTDLTREKMKESEDDLKILLKKEDEGMAKARKANEAKTRRRGTTLGGAAHKAKKVLTKSVSVKGLVKGPPTIAEDANSSLAPFIESGTYDPRESKMSSPPPKSASVNTTPLKSIMSNFGSSDCLESGTTEATSVHSDRGSSSRPYVRQTTVEIEKARKAVHFQRTFAVKTILTSRINKDQLQELVNEIMIMRKLDHPYVLKLYEVYHVKRKLWIVTELLGGGDLSSRKLNEHDTKNVVEMVLRALVYLHRMGIVHRDIKLENVMYENHSKNATVRLIDFGLSRTFDRTSVTADYTRTPYTMSPEAAAELVKKSKGQEQMTDKTDVWALGVITFIMLSGEFPFIKTNFDMENKTKMENLKRANFHFGVTWKGRGITGKAKAFVTGCLQVDPSKRWTAKQALEYLQNDWAPEVDGIWDTWRAEQKMNMTPEFVSQDLPGDDEDEDADGSRRAGRRVTTFMPAEDMTPEAAILPEDNLPEVKDYVEPSPADQQARAQLIKNHVQKVVRAKQAEGPDTNRRESLKIDMEEVERYTKFGYMKKTILITMANTMDRGDVGKLRELFLKADTDDTGTITLEELIAAFRKISPEVDEKRVGDLFFGIDRDKSGHVHYAEFLAALAESHGLVTLDRLTEAFDRIDTDGKGYITHDDLKLILGKDYDKETVDEMIEEGDFKKNGKIDYEELLHLMFSDPVKGDKLCGSD